MTTKKKFRIGDWVEVRGKQEILQTLDGDGAVEGMPFMPEMLAFCGQRFQVYKIAHKTCDYSVYPYRTRRLVGQFISKPAVMDRRTTDAKQGVFYTGKRIG